jgi:hypothetical protein
MSTVTDVELNLIIAHEMTQIILPTIDAALSAR